MPKYLFFTNGCDIRTAVRDSVYAGKISSTPEFKKIDFETEASDEGAAQTNLKAYLEENTDALKEFTGNTGFSAVIESIFR